MKASIVDAARDRRGVAVIEFAIILPVLLMIVAVLADLGVGYHLRLQLLKGVAAGSYYAVKNAGGISSANVAATTQTISDLVNGVVGSTVSVTVLVNGVAGSANADGYYCLNGSVANMASTGTGSTTCADGTMSGKFVTIRGSMSYMPVFPVLTSKITNLSAGETITARVQ